MSYSIFLKGKLPDKNIQGMSSTELERLNFDHINLDSDVGFILCVDIEYESDAVKDYVSEFPFIPERRKMKMEAMSDMQMNRLQSIGRRFMECERVLNTLYPQK